MHSTRKLVRSCGASTFLLVLASSARAQTTNYVSKFLTPTTIKDSQIFDNGNNVGIGTNAPQTKLTLRSNSTNDGLRILQGGTTAAAVGLFQGSPGGHNWALFSMGSGNFQGAGNFSIYDYTMGRDRFFITGTGDVGVDTFQPAAKLNVMDLNYGGNGSSPRRSGLFQLSSSVTPVLQGVRSEVTNLNGLAQNNSTGLFTSVSTPNLSGNGSSYNYGVYGTVTGGHNNEGVHVDVSSTASSAANIGVLANASGTGGSFNVGGYFYGTGGPSSYGVYAHGSAWAGFFLGSTFVQGGTYQGSDARIKRDIRTLDGALEKLSALRPTTYRFRTDEFPDLFLSDEPQTGFIAQELERVFPELVKTAIIHPPPAEQGAPAREVTEIKSVNYTGLIPVLVGAVQEQQHIIDSQNVRIADLEARMDSLLSTLAAPAQPKPR